eukprot:Colp12_sorted_trinity150504_noHs@22187
MTTLSVDPLTQSFRDEQWIATFGLNPLNVLDYLSTSQFWTKPNDNDNIRQQRKSLEEIKFLTGIQYEVVFAQHPVLYVIRKHRRLSRDHVEPLAMYYVLEGTIFQAPDLLSALRCRFRTCTHQLQEAFKEARQKAVFYARRRWAWDHDKPVATATTNANGATGTENGGAVKEPAEPEPEPVKRPLDTEHHERMRAILYDVFTTHAP